MKQKETILALVTRLDALTNYSLSLEFIFFKLHERLKFVAPQNRYGFSGIQDRFDLIIPPNRVVDISRGCTGTGSGFISRGK
jgi:hypothetical protein